MGADLTQNWVNTVGGQLGFLIGLLTSVAWLAFLVAATRFFWRKSKKSNKKKMK